uniref:Uncharacterized protein n=1 Tax=Anguilla anguilla TaxID=7936 RepID=A0A0E9WA56_ANGAN
MNTTCVLEWPTPLTPHEPNKAPQRRSFSVCIVPGTQPPSAACEQNKYDSTEKNDSRGMLTPRLAWECREENKGRVTGCC